MSYQIPGGTHLSRALNYGLKKLRSLTHQIVLQLKWFHIAVLISTLLVILTLLCWIPWISANLAMDSRLQVRKSPMDLLEGRKLQQKALEAEKEQDWGTANFHWERAITLNPADSAILAGWVRSLAFPPLTRQNYLRLKGVCSQWMERESGASELLLGAAQDALIAFSDYQTCKRWIHILKSNNHSSLSMEWRLAQCCLWSGDWNGLTVAWRNIQSGIQSLKAPPSPEFQHRFMHFQIALNQLNANRFAPIEPLPELGIVPFESSQHQGVDDLFTQLERLRLQLLISLARHDMGSVKQLCDELEQKELLCIENQIDLWNHAIENNSKSWNQLIWPALEKSIPFSQRDLRLLTEFCRSKGKLKQLTRLVEDWLERTEKLTDTDLEIAYLDLLIEQKDWNHLQFAVARLRNRGALGVHLSGLASYLEGLANQNTNQNAQALKCYREASSARYRAPEIGMHVFRGLWMNHQKRQALRLITSLENYLAGNEDYWDLRIRFHKDLEQKWEIEECQIKRNNLNMEKVVDPVFDSLENPIYASKEKHLKKERLREFKNINSTADLWSSVPGVFGFRFSND